LRRTAKLFISGQRMRVETNLDLGEREDIKECRSNRGRRSYFSRSEGLSIMA
jgi:hypothetical protein